MRKLILFGAVALTSIAAVQRAQAAVSYSYEADSSSYSGAVGSTVSVNIYLVETLTDASPSFIDANGGVNGAGAGVNVVGTTGGGTAAAIGSGSFTNSSSGFTGASDIVYNQFAGNNLEFIEGVPAVAPPRPSHATVSHQR